MPNGPLDLPMNWAAWRAAEHEPVRPHEVLVARRGAPPTTPSAARTAHRKRRQPGDATPFSTTQNTADRLGPVEPVGPAEPAHRRHPRGVGRGVGEERHEEPAGRRGRARRATGSTRWTATRAPVSAAIAHPGCPAGTRRGRASSRRCSPARSATRARSKAAGLKARPRAHGGAPVPGGCREPAHGGELRAEKVVEDRAHRRGHPLHELAPGAGARTPMVGTESRVRERPLGLAAGRRLRQEGGLVGLVRPLRRRPSAGRGRGAAPPAGQPRLQPLNQPFFFSPPGAAPSASPASDASSLIRLSIALRPARLDGLEERDLEIDLLGEAELHAPLALPEPVQEPGQLLGRHRGPPEPGCCARPTRSTPAAPTGPAAWRSARSRTRSRPAESHSSTIETIRRWSPAASAPASSATLASGHEPVDVQDVGLRDLAAAERDHLVEDRLGVAHPAVREPRDAGERRRRPPSPSRPRRSP